MAGMPTGGVVSIPNSPSLQVNTTRAGSWFNFKVLFGDRDHTGKSFMHLYKVSMWVPEEEVEDLQENIKPGRFFRISGHLEARVNKDSEYDPATRIKVDYRNFMSLKIENME
jgi:hypothetical protein